MTAQNSDEGRLQINFGILCDAWALETWQLNSLKQLLAVANVRAVLLINQRAPAAHAGPLPDSLASLPSITLTDTAARGGHEVLVDTAVESIQGYELDFIPELFHRALPT